MITHYIRKSPKGERLEEFTPAQANFIGAVFHGGVTLKTAEKLLTIWNRQGTQNGKKTYEYRLLSNDESPADKGPAGCA